MTSRRRIDKNVQLILVAGFGLAILSLLASGYLAVQAMERMEERSSVLLHDQQISNKLIDEIQGEEAGLSTIFYQLKTSPETNRELLRERLQRIEQDIERTLRSADSSPYSDRWKGVEAAVSAFLVEVRRTLANQPGQEHRSDEIYRRHEALVSELANLVATNYEHAVRTEQAETERTQSRLRGALLLLGVALLLALICAFGTVHITSRVFERMNWQARELSRLSGHVLEAQESIVRRFSRELHDELGQTMTAIEATLVAFPATSPEQEARIEDCQLLAKDAISKIRSLSQLLRPSMLDDFGLGPSLQWLAESFRQRTGIEIRAAILFDGRLPEQVETHLFRVAQEALTNAARHSGATFVEIDFRERGDTLRLMIRDNGKGFHGGGRQHYGLGLIGMRERVVAIGGEIVVQSSNRGVTIAVEVPVEPVGFEQADPSFVSGRP